MNLNKFDEQRIGSFGKPNTEPMASPFEDSQESPVEESVEAPVEAEPVAIVADVEDEAPQTPEVTDKCEVPKEVVKEEKKPEKEAFSSWKDRNGVNTHRFSAMNSTIDGATIRGVFNPGLKTFCAGLRKANPTIQETLVVEGTSIRNSDRTAIWEEGGAKDISGTVLIATDQEGKRKSAITVFNNKDYVNGRHALVPVEIGDFIIMGYQNKDIEEIACFKITDINDSDVENRKNINIEIVGRMGVKADSDETIWVNEGDCTVFNIKHPAIISARTRYRAKFAVGPCYIREYDNHSLTSDDLREAFADKEYVSTMQNFNTLEEMYAAAEAKMCPLVETAPKRHHVLVTTILDINTPDPVTNKLCVWAFVCGTIFNADRDVRSSRGGRKFYGRVKLVEGQQFFYIDDPESKFDVSRIINQMKKDKNGNSYKFRGTTVRRMTTK